MAERRMFTKKVIESDDFLDMPLSAQALYLHLNMAADDDGFVNNSKMIQRMTGASAEDYKMLLEKNFLIEFNTGVIVIRHWKVHNYIQKDRYHSTIYKEEKALLSEKQTNEYGLKKTVDTKCVQVGYKMDTKSVQPVSELDTEVRLGKDRDRLGKGRSEIKDISSELPEEISEQSPKKEPELADVEAIPLCNGTEYRLPLSEYEEYLRLYPGVDIKQEFRNMRGWCLKNVAKRKTPKGVGRFINSWLAREQDRGGRKTFSGNGNVIANNTGSASGKETVSEFAQRMKEWAESG